MPRPAIEQPRALSQPLKAEFGLRVSPLRAVAAIITTPTDVGQRVERHRDQAERDELERDVVIRRIDELRNEGEEERGGLRVQGFYQHPFAKHLARPCRDDSLLREVRPPRETS